MAITLRVPCVLEIRIREQLQLKQVFFFVIAGKILAVKVSVYGLSKVKYSTNTTKEILWVVSRTRDKVIRLFNVHTASLVFFATNLKWDICSK